MNKALKKAVVLGVFSIIFSLSPVVAKAGNIELNSVARICPKCGVGTVNSYTSRSYEHDESFKCSHKPNGTDIYKVYNVTTRSYCNNCSYSTKYEIEDHVFYRCNGY